MLSIGHFLRYVHSTLHICRLSQVVYPSEAALEFIIFLRSYLPLNRFLLFVFIFKAIKYKTNYKLVLVQYDATLSINIKMYCITHCCGSYNLLKNADFNISKTECPYQKSLDPQIFNFHLSSKVTIEHCIATNFNLHNLEIYNR